MASIAVIGPGAIGSTLAAWLAKDGAHHVAICARSPIERLRITAPDETIEVSPAVLTHHASAMPVDWVIAATKTYDSLGCIPWIERLTGSATRLAVVQNGVEHRDRFSAVVPPERTVPVIAYLPAERVSPAMEIDGRNGVIVRAGEKHGIETPVSRMLTALLRAVQA